MGTETLYNGAIGGIVVGGLVGAVASIWGGYELGTMINDYFEFQNTVGRGALDVLVMGVLASPIVPTTAAIGSATGVFLGYRKVVKEEEALERRINGEQRR